MSGNAWTGGCACGSSCYLPALPTRGAYAALTFLLLRQKKSNKRKGGSPHMRHPPVLRGGRRCVLESSMRQFYWAAGGAGLDGAEGQHNKLIYIRDAKAKCEKVYTGHRFYNVLF